MKLKTKFFLWITALEIGLLISVGFMTIFSQRRVLKMEMDQHNQQTVQRLARVCEESLLQSNLLFFNYVKGLKDERGFIGAFFVDSDGVVRIHSNPNMLGTSLPPPDENSATTIDLAAPVIFAGGRVGTARLQLSRGAIDNFINESTQITMKRVGVIMLVALFAGFLAAWWLAKTMVTPIQEIVTGMGNLSKGTLEPIHLSKRHDELGWLGKEINVTIRQLRELDEMKKNFFSRITHELRSPLAAIQSLLSVFLNGLSGPISAEQTDMLLTIQNNNSRLTRLIDDLLTTSKIEANKEDLECNEVDLTECIKETVKLYRPLAQEKGLELKLEAPGTKAYVWADREKVVHIITNLLSNGIKYTDRGSVAVHLEEEAEEVKVTIADTGIGIPSKEREMVFDRFYRSRSAKNTKGTGLGLFIVKSLVEMQKGKIDVTENEGGGTKFVIVLPKP